MLALDSSLRRARSRTAANARTRLKRRPTAQPTGVAVSISALTVLMVRNWLSGVMTAITARPRSIVNRWDSFMLLFLCRRRPAQRPIGSVPAGVAPIP